MVQNVALAAPAMPEAAEPVRRALSLNTLRVSHASRPSDFADEFAKWHITHCLIFDEADHFLGVVDLRALAGQSRRHTFVELLPDRQPPAIRADASLAELCECFHESRVTCALVYERGSIAGLVTRDSFLELLLRENLSDLIRHLGCEPRTEP